MAFFDSFKKKKKTMDFINKTSIRPEGLPTPPPLHDTADQEIPASAELSKPPKPESLLTKPQPKPVQPEKKPLFTPSSSAQTTASTKSIQDIPPPFPDHIIPSPSELPKKYVPMQLQHQMAAMHSKPRPMPMHKPVPNELPEFPVKLPLRQSLRLPIHEIEHPDIKVPVPPPNLRSEISPLELEKLEEKYLHKHPPMSDMEAPYDYDKHKKIKKPLFVRTDNYRQILNNFIDIKDILTESEEIIYRLENLKKNADLEYSEHKRTIEDIQRKLIYIDKSLFET
ncbi:hypothetical protein JXB41_05660 [Candidatus Woesearchaeota archaeon]|nr:hypothetical protein [Candidatus Woesearchaeota archaeon]